jgi:hypothetical protein
MCVVPSAAIPARTRAASALKSVANTGALYSELHPVKCNKLTTGCQYRHELWLQISGKPWIWKCFDIHVSKQLW